ncbi:MAG TPA: hypothetical protein VHU82_12445 [Vicinamibacterales bacterium]|jgi:ABC-type lipoprotein release transport system permease subunit|nr:hypothetical protein [Vicinamibacterales bacterium]
MPTDPMTIGAASLLFAGVTLVASWVATGRATAIDPLDAIRGDRTGPL